MVAAAAYVEQGEEIRGLTAACEHGGGSAFKLRDLGGYMVVGGILEACVEIPACLKVKKLTHILACVVFECGALYYRNLTGFSVAGSISALNANTVYFH